MNYQKRGEIWWVNFESAVGTEIRKIRPAVVISNDISNKKSTKVNVIPITSKIKALPLTIIVEADNKNNLPQKSLIVVQGITTFDKKRFKSKIGVLSEEKLKEVEFKLKRHLGL